MSTIGGGRRTPSVAGSRMSVYSHGSTLRTIRTGAGSKASRSHSKKPWYKKPIVSTACYTDLQKGSWHIGFYSLFLSVWTIFTSGFDLHCLEHSMPGSNHTGYYLFSYEFVYVGNQDVQNLLIASSTFSLAGGLILFVASCWMLDGLRKEDERNLVFWLYTMGIFAPWKIVAWGFAGIVNDMIFIYNVLMLIIWAGLNMINCFSWICIYSLYLELKNVSKLQDLARLKMDTMSGPASRAASAFGSRPTSPYINKIPHHLNQHHYPAGAPIGGGGSLPINHGQQSHQGSVQDPLYATRGQVTSSDIY